MNLRRNDLWLLAVPVLLLSAWLGARSLNADAIWFDEYYSIFESGGAYYGPLSPLELTFRVASYSVWPPAYNFVLASWSAGVGWSPVAGRALSWLLGLLAIAVVYRLARLLAPRDKTFAFSAIVLMGGSAFYIYYLHELRGYTLHILLGCGAAMCYWHLLKRPASRAARVFFIGTLTLLLYSHPVGQLWFAVLASFHIFFERRSERWKSILFLFFLAGAFYVPWIIVMVMRVRQEMVSPRGLDPILMLSATATAYTNWLTVIISALCVLTLGRIHEKSIQFLWWWLGGVLVLALLVDQLVPFLFHIRLLIAILPALMLLAAVGLAELRRFRWFQMEVAGLWLLMGIYLSSDPGFMLDLPGASPTISWQGFAIALNTLNQQANVQDAILFRVANGSEEHWLNPSLQYYLNGSPLHFSLLSIVSEHDVGSFDQRLRSFLNDAPHVWVAVVPDIDPDAQTAALSQAMAEHYTLCQTVIDLPDMRLDLYARLDIATCSTSAQKP